MSETIQTSLKDGVMTLRFNRPDKKNALTSDMYLSLAENLRRAESDKSVGAVLFAGTDGCFTAGNDLKDFVDRSDHGPRPSRQFLQALTDASVPYVAAVDGVAIGIGSTMLLHCDFVYASEKAVFSFPFINLGLVPEAASSLLLRRLTGYNDAAELLMMGDNFDAQRATEIGLVREAVESSELENIAMTRAKALAQKPRDAMRATKTLMRRSEEELTSRIEQEVAVFNEALESPAAKEILSAFLEKRKPDRSKYD